MNLEKRMIKPERTKGKKVRFLSINDSLLAEIMSLKEKETGDLGVFPFRLKADVENFTFHDLRRSFGTRLLERGVNIRTIQKLYGQSSIAVAERYLHPRDELSVEAVELLVKKDQEKVSLGGHVEKECYPVTSAASIC